MKTITVNVTFPEVGAATAEQSATVKASTIPYGVKLALVSIWQRPAIKRHRITQFRLGVVVANCNEDEE